MKTRVLRWFDLKHGLFMYNVEVLDHWRALDLRKAYPSAVLWQQIKQTPDLAEAQRCAMALAENENASTKEIIFEYGESDLVECTQDMPCISDLRSL